MTDQELTELRIFALGMQPFLPILEKRKAATLGILIQKFNQNEDIIREAAKLAAMHELEGEIRGKLRTFENLSKGEST